MTDVELAIRLTADATDAANAMDDVGDASKRMADDVEAATRQADQAASRMDSLAESSDNVASKGAQAAGALSGLGDLVGGKFGAAMVAGGVATQAAADAGDLLNVVTESAIVRKLKDVAATTAQRTAALASAAATRTVAAAQWAWNAAMSANPIGLVIAAVGALVAGFVLLYKRSERFRAIVQAAMRGARVAINAVWTVLRKLGAFIIKVLVAYVRTWGQVIRTVFNAARAVVAGVMGRIVSAVQGARQRISSAWQAVKSTATTVWNGIRDTIGNIVTKIVDRARDVKDTFVDAWNKIRTAGVNAFNAIMKPVNSLIDLIERIIDKIKDIDFPDIDVPLIRAIPGVARAAGGSTQPAPAGNGDTVHIHLPLLAALNERAIAQLIAALESYYRRRGQRLQLVVGS